MKSSKRKYGFMNLIRSIKRPKLTSNAKKVRARHLRLIASFLRNFFHLLQELDLSQFSSQSAEETIVANATEATNEAATVTNVNPTLHVISQEGLRLDDEKLEAANFQYVDLAIKEGQQIRLRVPLDADPIAYAKEYLQSLADNGEMLALEAVAASAEAVVEGQVTNVVIGPNGNTQTSSEIA